MTVKVSEVTKDAWVDLTDANVSDLTFQNQGQWPVYIAVTAGAAPAATDTAYIYRQYEGEVKKALSALTYNATPTRVFARAVAYRTTVYAEF